jgi:hypothetical protein
MHFQSCFSVCLSNVSWLAKMYINMCCCCSRIYTPFIVYISTLLFRELCHAQKFHDTCDTINITFCADHNSTRAAWQQTTIVLIICKTKSRLRQRHCGLARHFKTDPTETVALCFGYAKTLQLTMKALWPGASFQNRSY